MAVQIGSNISDGFFDKIQFRLITRIKIDKLYYIELNWILRKDNHQNQINDYIDILQMDVFFFFGIDIHFWNHCNQWNEIEKYIIKKITNMWNL